jgi:flagellar motor protein MotB
MQDGVIDFIDHHTKPEYSSKMMNLGGRVSGLSSEANKMADVDLRGNLENHSPLRITGRINPLRDDLFVDLKVSFTDIELSPLTPYSGTYLGYSVDKGKLFLDLKYHIENKNLDSSNSVFIDQLTFGNKIESDKATSLPVRLAVALLKDRKGEIHLDLPVTGRTDDPQFSVWRVVFKILKNLLVKAATAPFALLSSIFGGKDDFSNVPFAYGSARLSDAEKAKLAKLSQALADRPALKLEVSGFVDRERDPEGYRNVILLKKMRNEKFLALVKAKKIQEGQGAESMEILPQEYSIYLKSVYKKEKFPKPRNFIGMLKDLPDDEMRKLFLTHTVVESEDLQNLARERAVAVRNFLVTEGKLPPERVFEKKGEIFKAPAKEGENAARVEFGVAVQ